MSSHGDQGERERELDRVREAIAIARFWLEQFASPHGFVWRGDRSPHDFAREALEAVGQAMPADPGGAIARGTDRMERLRTGRTGFVEFHQQLARQALAAGQLGAARAALRALRASDFAGEVVDDHLATLRDGQASPDALLRAVRAIIALPPRPASEVLE